MVPHSLYPRPHVYTLFADHDPQLRAICCVWVMSSLVCGLFASIWDLRFLICRLLEASMHFCLYYVLIPRHVYCHHHSCLQAHTWFSAYILRSIRRKQHPHPQGEGGKPYTTYRTHTHRQDPHPQGGGATIQYLQHPHPQGGRENHDHLHEWHSIPICGNHVISI